MKKTTKWLSVTLMIFLALGGIFMAYNYILYPAYLSVQNACQFIDGEELGELGYYVAGTYNTSSQEITLYTTDPKIFKHEKIHFFQDQAGRLNSCDEPYFLFIDECEAYFGQYLPNFIYDRIYY